MTIGTDYQTLNSDFYYNKTKNLQGRASRYQNANADETGIQTTSNSLISSKGNTCTDGSDDGKIGILSMIGNTIEGAGKCALNMVKSAIKHPFKTAALIGACCIPVVGPVIAGGLAVYGLYRGVTTVAKGVSTAMNATTDAEAKDAFESIGEGTFTAGISGLALKGSVGQLKSQLQGSSTTVSAVKTAKSEGASAGEMAEIAVREGVKETAGNIGQVAQSVIKKADKVYQKGKQYVESAREGTLKDTLSDDITATADAAGQKVKEVVDKAQKTKEDIRFKRAESKTLLKDMKSQAKLDGAEITELKNGGFEAKYQDGTVMKFNSKGVLKQEISGDTVTTYDSKGRITKTETTTKDTQGAQTTETVTTKEYNPETNQLTKRSSKTTTKTEVDGKTKIEAESSKTVNRETGITKTSKSQTLSDGKVKTSSVKGITRDGQLYTGVKIENGKTTWFENGVEQVNPSLMTKTRINYKSTNAGIKLDKFIGDGSTTIGPATITSKQAQVLGTVLLENQ